MGVVSLYADTLVVDNFLFVILYSTTAKYLSVIWMTKPEN